MAFSLSKAGFGKESVSNLDKIKMIPLEKIEVNEKNFYKLSKIEELMESIRMVGLLDPVRVVAAEDGKYRLVSGHRRYEAFLELDAGRCAEDTTYRNIPALVLENMDDLTETFALVTANSTARELTYEEKLEQEKQLRETLMAMKAAGREVPRNLGQYIADQIGVSRNEVSRMHSVNENLIPEAREKVAAGEMTAQQAYELSRKPKEEQRASSYVQEQVAAYQQEAAAEKALLDRFVEIHGGAIAYEATRLLTGERFESIKLLGERYRTRGGNIGGVLYASSAKGVYVGRLDARPHSWTAVWDAVALYSMRKIAAWYAQKRMPSNYAEHKSVWHKGEPVVNGSYACLVRYAPTDERCFRRILWYRDGHWFLNDQSRISGGGIADPVSVVAWIPLPEEDPE